MISVRFGPLQLQITASKLGRIISWPFRQLAGTPALSREVHEVNQKIDLARVHISAMTEIFYVVVADLMDKWPPEKREKALRAIANFTIVDRGLDSIKLQGNPFTPDEIQRLRLYTQWAQEGSFFTPEDALDYRQLSERAAREYGDRDWVTELLKIGVFIFAIYGLSQLFKKKD